VPWLGSACGTCRYCLTGWETLCEAQRNTGYSVDGCYAEYFLAEAAFATPVPDGIDPAAAAPLTCAGVTTYKAVKTGGVRPGDLVLISGIGGLGHLALQYAKIFGGTVAAVDITDEKLALARDLGRAAQARRRRRRDRPGRRRPVLRQRVRRAAPGRTAGPRGAARQGQGAHRARAIAATPPQAPSAGCLAEGVRILVLPGARDAASR
jgi:threonine dehydrogenase-like Zn-dependent dehydrogenase